MPKKQARPALLDEALAFGGPIVVFDMVNLSFDEKVILRDLSFTLHGSDLDPATTMFVTTARRNP